MKLIKARIRRGDASRGERQMVYPARWNAQEVDRHSAGGLEYSQHMRHAGSPEEWVLVCLEDAVADEYAADPDMEEVDEATADADSDAWRIMRGEPLEQVRSSERLQAIAAKQAAGIALTQEDRDALDPTSPVPGINRLEKPSERRARAETARGERS